MPRSSTWRDLVPGMFAMAGVVAVVLAVLLFARIGALRGSTYELWAPTPLARGLMNNSEVWLDGQKVGLVRDVHFEGPEVDTSRRVVIHLDVLEKYRGFIRRDSYSQIRPGGSLLGTPVLFIASGSAASPVLDEGDTLAVMPQGDTEGMTSQFALASREFPKIIDNVKLLNNALMTARGTMGAMLSTDEGIQQLQTFSTRFSRVTDQVTAGRGTVGLALRGNELIDRAKRVMAQTDSLRLLLSSAGPRTSVGRFRKDSTLLQNVSDVRTELATVRLLLAEPRGTAGRVLADSAVFHQLDRARREMDALFKDLKRRPLRYISL